MIKSSINMLTNHTKIKIEMMAREVTGASIARSLGVSRTAICHVVYGRNKSPRIRKAIARALGLKVQDLWPDNGNREAA